MTSGSLPTSHSLPGLRRAMSCKLTAAGRYPSPVTTTSWAHSMPAGSKGFSPWMHERYQPAPRRGASYCSTSAKGATNPILWRGAYRPDIPVWVGAGCAVKLGAGVGSGVLVCEATAVAVDVWLATSRVGKGIGAGVAEAGAGARPVPAGRREGDAATSTRAVIVGMSRSSNLPGKGVGVDKPGPGRNRLSPRATASIPTPISKRPTTDMMRRLPRTRFIMYRALLRPLGLPSALQGPPASPSLNSTSTT